MGRTRGFDTAVVVAQASEQFRSCGYEATSLDDLLHATGLHRGSLYQAFGSKRGLFLAALQHVSGADRADATVDLLLVALVELAPIDDAVRALVADRVQGVDGIALRLGHRLLERARIDLPVQSTKGTDSERNRHR